LGEELKESLRGAKIGKVKGRIAVEDTDQRHCREMKPFGDHLGANENVGFAGSKFPKELLMASFTTCGVSVHP
jgi:hypothetical protein